MRARVLHQPGDALRLETLPEREPAHGEVAIDIKACGVCRTDLHIVDGDMREPKLPIVPGHEIVGWVRAVGVGVDRLRPGMRVGVLWLGSTCNRCDYCRIDRENLCDAPGFTGYTIDGGYADMCIADARYVFELHGGADDAALAPLRSALIGHRSLAMAGECERLGIYGFGAAAHIVTQIARWQDRRVYAFTRPGDLERRHSPESWVPRGLAVQRTARLSSSMRR